jgi:hypothetical protein
VPAPLAPPRRADLPELAPQTQPDKQIERASAHASSSAVLRPLPPAVRRRRRLMLSLLLLSLVTMAVVFLSRAPDRGITCPVGMALVGGPERTLCIDRAPLADHGRKRARLTWDEARAACAARSARLCAAPEWERACRTSAWTFGRARGLEWTALASRAAASPGGSEDGDVAPCTSAEPPAEAGTPPRLPARCCTDLP